MDINTLKYQLVCKNCHVIVGFTNKYFTHGELLTVEDIYYFNGTQAKDGDKLQHVFKDNQPHVQIIEIVPNPFYEVVQP